MAKYFKKCMIYPIPGLCKNVENVNVLLVRLKRNIIRLNVGQML